MALLSLMLLLLLSPLLLLLLSLLPLLSSLLLSLLLFIFPTAAEKVSVTPRNVEATSGHKHTARGWLRTESPEADQ